MCNPDFRLNHQIKRSRSLPIHIIRIRIIQILPNLDRNLGSTSVRIKQSCLYFYYDIDAMIYIFFSLLAGACMSIVSSCILLCKTIRELAYDNKNMYHRGKIPMCTDSIKRASSQLAEALSIYQIPPETPSGSVTSR